MSEGLAVRADPAEAIAAAAARVAGAGSYAVLEPLSPLVHRLLAPNPGPFTYTGTQTYLVGTDRLAVIDPGPDEPRHVRAILQAVGGRPVSHILVTHSHIDHSPAAPALKAATGAELVGGPQLADVAELGWGYDQNYAPDRVLGDGDRVEGQGWTLVALTTPGHISNHLCYALEPEQALFTGDHVMGWSTSVISPPDGSVGEYMRSLAKLAGRGDRIYYPAHGEPVRNPQQLVHRFIQHRRRREAQVRRALEAGPRTIDELVAALYPKLRPELVGGAGRSVLAHLIDLEARGLARADGVRWRAAA